MENGREIPWCAGDDGFAVVRGKVRISKRGGCIDPQNPSLGATGIFPAMGRRTFEIETVARLKVVTPLVVEPDLEFPAQDVQKLFALVSIGFATATPWFNAEEMRLHSGVAPGEELHADFGAGFENFALQGTDQDRSIAVSFEQGDDVGFVEAGDSTQSGDGRAHLAAFESAEKSDGNAGGASHPGERETPFQTQTAETLAGRLPGIGGSDGDALFLEGVHERGGSEAAGAPRKNGALEKANIGFRVEAIATPGTLGSNQAKRFPGAQGGGRDAEPMGDLGDAEQPSGG